jgi:hypothetical protein
MSSFALRRNARHVASISALLNWSGWLLSGEATGSHRTRGGVRKGEEGGLRYGVIDNDREIPQHRQWGRVSSA